MKRTVTGIIAACVVALLAAACDDATVGVGGGAAWVCSQYSTCGTCTPVEGCGWCFSPIGGECVPSPAYCAPTSAQPANSTSWTWNPSGCGGTFIATPTVADASVTDTGSADARAADAVGVSVVDAGVDARVVDAAAEVSTALP